MTIDVNSATGQTETAYDGFADYFNQMNKYLQNTDGSILPPDFSDIASTLDYSELHRVAMTRAGDNASYENGAALENINHIAAIIREFDIRRKGKVGYYSDAVSESRNESDYYVTSKVLWSNMLNGNFSQGETI